MKSIKNRNLQSDFGNYSSDPVLFPKLLKQLLASPQRNQELDGKNEYKLFGLKPDATDAELDKAFVKYLNENSKGKERTIGEGSYKRLLLLREAQAIFRPHLAPPFTLAQAETTATKLTPDQYDKAMKSLVILANDKTEFPNLFSSIANKLNP